MTDTPVQLGCWIDLPSPHVAEIIGGAGFDFAVIDLEHGPMSVETASLCMMALRGTGTRAWVRVPEASEAAIKRALDAGAAGIMVPNVPDAATAERISRWFHYAPLGQRGRAPDIIRASGYGRDSAYLSGWPGDHQLILQIETPEALEQAEEIAAVPGVSMLFFGPTDFSAAAGFSLDDPRVRTAAARVAEVAQRTGKAAGTIVFPGADAGTLSAAGYGYLAVASDVIALRT
ncbi:MAG: aldolase/citrate lyase family protein, partial [Pseudomonadota bacterium]